MRSFLLHVLAPGIQRPYRGLGRRTPWRCERTERSMVPEVSISGVPDQWKRSYPFEGLVSSSLTPANPSWGSRGVPVVREQLGFGHPYVLRLSAQGAE